MQYSVISADNHIIEPRDLFVTRMPKEFRDRAPRVMRGADGGDGWTFDGKPPRRTIGIEATAGRAIRISGYKWDEILPGNYDPAAHVSDMRKEGVDASVLFGTISMGAYTLSPPDFAMALMQTYNDWLLDDFVTVDPKRLIGLPLLPVNHGMDCAVAEFKRCLAKGARGFFIPTFPDVSYVDKAYDVLWAAAADAGTPLCLHRTSGGNDPAGMGDFKFDVPGINVAGTVVRFFSGVQPLTFMIFSGVFQRHPKLIIMDAEVNFGWVTFWKQTMDDCYEKQKGWAKFPIDNPPGEALGKNVFVTVLDDKIGFELVRLDPQLADVALFSTDYPHSFCLWPDTAKYIDEVTKPLDPVAKHKILAGNAARIFHLN
jgi:predicted TIM-barrel fold metal-dependent hydrolase